MFERPRAEDPYLKLPPLPSFELVSSDITDGQPLPIKHAAIGAGAGAENLSPQLSWSGFPEDTESFVVSCFDADAPTPSGYWHWTIADIPASVTSLTTGAVTPDGAVDIKNDNGLKGYAGPMPPVGDHPHRLFYVVHAVKVRSIEVDPGVTPVVVAFHMLFTASARAQIVPTMQL